MSTRTGALVVILFAILGAGVVASLRGDGAEVGLDCAPSEVRWVDAGTWLIAKCMPGAPVGEVPAAQAITVGVKLDLNGMTESELALIPGIGGSLAAKLVEERRRLGAFRSWAEVDRVRGVGPAKVEVLRALTEIRP